MVRKGKILIVGAAGFIGNASFSFLNNHHLVAGVDTYNSGSLPLVVDKDFSITKRLIAQESFDVILNCAGASNIQQSFINPEHDYALNTDLVSRLIDAIKTTSPQSKFINLSSAAVYGNPARLPVSETEQPAPLSPYGEHKLKAEGLIHNAFLSDGIKGLSLRIFSAYGVGLKRQFFFDLSQKFIQNPDSVSLFGTGKESRDFIYASDIAAAIECLFTRAEFDGGVYNLGSGAESFIDETATAYADVFGYKGSIRFSNNQMEGYPVNWRADISKIKTLGFRPAIELREGMARYANWIKRNFTA